MNVEQHMLIKLAEECAEVGKQALKMTQFGFNTNNHLGQCNADVLRDELNDIMAIIEVMNTSFNLNFEPDRDKIEAKKIKMGKYLIQSINDEYVTA